MLKPENLHNLVIETYYGKDNATVIDAYLDVLDYNNLSNESIEKVLNSVSFKDVIVLLILLLRIVDEVVLIDADNLVKPFFDMSFFTSFLGH